MTGITLSFHCPRDRQAVLPLGIVTRHFFTVGDVIAFADSGGPYRVFEEWIQHELDREELTLLSQTVDPEGFNFVAERALNTSKLTIRKDVLGTPKFEGLRKIDATNFIVVVGY